MGRPVLLSTEQIAVAMRNPTVSRWEVGHLPVGGLEKVRGQIS
jgi:hypothetical protein